MNRCEEQRLTKMSKEKCDADTEVNATAMWALSLNCDQNMCFHFNPNKRRFSSKKRHCIDQKPIFLTLGYESCLTFDSGPRDWMPLCANMPFRSWCYILVFLVMASSFSLGSSQATVMNDVPPGCMFVQSSHRSMDKVIDDISLASAWRRLWANQQDSVVRTCSCSSIRLFSIPKGLTSIAEAVYLDENDITTLTKVDLAPNPGNFTMTSPTLALSLRSNRISTIESKAFRYLPKLKLLVLKDNFIKHVKWTLSEKPVFRKLMELDLSMNLIEDFGSHGFGSFPYLERLDLRRNKIRTVSGAILSRLPKLEYLDLSSNLIKETGLSPSDVVIQSLRFLSVADNFLEDFRSLRLVEFWRKLPYLTTLDISSNTLTSGIIPREAFYGLSYITTLNISRCGVKKLERGWIDKQLSNSLKVLDLSNNLLQTISANYLTLQLEDAQNLTTIPTLSSQARDNKDLNAIEVLLLNGNDRLIKIEDDAFNHVPKLRLLFLQNCALRRFSIASTKNRYGNRPIETTLPLLTSLWIFGNPIACDCYIRFVKEWSVSAVSVEETDRRYIDAPFYTIDSQKLTISSEYAICAWPESLAGITVEAAPTKSMTCQEEPYSVLVAMLIGPLTFAGSVALTILCGSLHVCIARMKRGTVLSYHAREELRRNPKIRNRRSTSQPILSNFVWSRSHDDLSTYSTGSRGSHHTNLILGNIEDHQRRRDAQNARTKLFPERFLSASPPSFNVEEQCDHSRTHSAGYCSVTGKKPSCRMVMSDGTLNAVQKRLGNGGNADSAQEKESERTGSASSDIPFIDEDYRSDDNKRSFRLSSSCNSICNNSSRSGLLDSEEGANDIRHRLPGEKLRLRKPVIGRSPSNTRQKSPHHIPGLSSSGQPSSEETSL